MSRILDFLASLRLTLTLLVASIVVVFLATLEQVAWGVWHVQDAYFESWGVLYPLAESAPAKFPLPGGFLLGTLSKECADYVAFHLNVAGCRYCQANMADLERLQAEAADAAHVRRRKYFQSSAGYLRRGSPKSK